MSSCCDDGKELKCSNCGYIIKGDGTLRCPRCFNLLIKPGCNGNCSQCASKK